MPDGSPQVTPVWFDYVGGAIRVNSARGRVKDRNMKEGAAVALSILDPDNPYRYLQVRGRVRKVTEQGGSASTPAKKYLGQDKYYHQPGDVRVMNRAARRSPAGQPAHEIRNSTRNWGPITIPPHPGRQPDYLGRAQAAPAAAESGVQR